MLGRKKIDLGYKEACKNTDIPIVDWFGDIDRKAPKISAAFLPTQSHRPLPETSIERLKSHCDKIYLLFSDQPSDWAAKLQDDEKIVIWTDLNEKRNSADFMQFESTKISSSKFKPAYDIPYKRNISLIEARDQNFKSILMLDDDINIGDEGFWTARTALDKGCAVASYHVLDYPDVSTVDHIERILLKRPSRVSIGGNCFVANMDKVVSFFPEAYNDDWYFIFSHLYTGEVYSLGTALQRPYQPWNDLDRIAFEQLGDIIIEGAKANFLKGNHPFSGDKDHWDPIIKTGS